MYYVKCGIIYIVIRVPGERMGTVERTLKQKQLRRITYE